MAVVITHAKVTSIPDDLTDDPEVVSPVDWNDDHTVTGLATVATTGAYSDLTGTPSLATVATSGDYDDLTNKPTLGTAAAADTGDFAAASHTHTASEITDFSTAADARVSAAIGVTVQAYAANLTEWAGINPSANGASLVSAADYAAMRTLLDLEAGTDFNAYSANLAEWSGINPSANGGSLVAAADYAAMRALLDLEVGTDFLSPSAIAAAYQPLDAGLTDLAGLAVTDSNIIVGNGTNWVAESGATARTSLGLGTGNNVTFSTVTASGINLSNADTTLARVSAGDFSVEGNIVYRAGGTDVPLADGGTGASLTDPNADRIMFWDDSAGAVTWLSLGTGLAFNVTSLDLDADLASWSAVTRAAGFDTFTATPSIANLMSLLTDDASGLGTFLTTPSSANFRALLTDEAGSSGGIVSAGYVTGAAEDFLPAEYFVPPITNGAQGGIRILGSNGQALFYYAFDTTTQEILWAKWFPRKRYDGGTITFVPIWTAESGSGTVEFELSGVAVSNDDPLDAAPGTAQASADTLLSAGDLHEGPTSSAITIAGTFADGDCVWLKLVRDVANDTLGVDAQLIGIKIFYTTDQGNDA